MRRQLAAVLGAAALVAATAGYGYVRSRTAKSNSPLAWRGACAYVTPDADGTADLSETQVQEAIQRSADTWSGVPCSYFRLAVDPPEPGGAAVLDHPVARNYVVFRSDEWCPPDSDEPCYDSNATALTTVFYVDRPGDSQDGRILDADIELNNVNFAFTVDGTPPPGANGRPVADLQNTLTHELGHLLGLDHTCYDGWNPCDNGVCKVNHLACQTERDCFPLDQHGQPIPACSDPLPAEVTEATMYNYANAGDTAKRTLAQDDVDGICGVYPLALDPGTCERVDTSGDGGCCAAGQRPGPAAPLLALVGLLLARRRRRR